MISSRIFVGLLFYLHGCFALPTVCDVVLATRIIQLSTNSNFCDDYVFQSSSLCGNKYFVSSLYSCNDHGEIQSIDLSGIGIFGETITVRAVQRISDDVNICVLGRLSSSPADLSSVTFLSLSHNGLFGSIPLWIAKMPKLQHLNLSFNDLTGAHVLHDDITVSTHVIIMPLPYDVLHDVYC